MHEVLHLARPFEKTPQVAALAPEELPKFQEANLLHFQTAVGLNAPQQVWAAPRRQTVTTSGVPQEAGDGEHGNYDNRSQPRGFGDWFESCSPGLQDYVNSPQAKIPIMLRSIDTTALTTILGKGLDG